jgi:putative hydroxymethylpyrimidine transport system substrate-binding protein
MRTAKRIPARSAIRVCAIVAVVLGLAGCGALKNTYKPNPGSANQLKVVLQGQPDASDIGIYDAMALGYLKQTDLDVTIVTPSNDSSDTAIKQIYSGAATIAVTDQPGVLFARNGSDAVVAVAAAVQHPLDAIVSLQSTGINTIGDLKGKRVALTGSAGTRSLFGAMLSHAGLPASAVKVTVVDPSQLTSELLSGKVAATFGGNADMETATLVQQHKLVNTITPSQGGVPDYNGLVIAVQKGEIVDHAPIPRRFVQAVARGYKAVRANPQQAVANMIAAVPSLAPQKQELLAAVEAMLPDFFPTEKFKGKAEPWGFMSVAQWNKFGTWLRESKLIGNPEAPVDASTNELLAGQGV